MTHKREGGGGGGLGVALTFISLRLSLDKPAQVIFLLTGNAGKTTYSISRGKLWFHSRCLCIVWLCDPWSWVLPHQRNRYSYSRIGFMVYSMCFAPSWGSDDAYFMVLKMYWSLEQLNLTDSWVLRGTSIFIVKCCPSKKWSILRCALWHSRVSKCLAHKMPFWHWDCWDVVSNWQLNCPLGVLSHSGSRRFKSSLQNW